MGAWGEGPFENDTAADWVFEFEQADLESGLTHVQVALDGAAGVGSADYLDSDAGAEALAAAELVAAMRGAAIEKSPYNEAAIDWVARTSPVADQALVDLAVHALDRVVADNSELAQLWDEAEPTSWRAAVEERKASIVT